MLTNGALTIFNAYYEPLDGVDYYFKTVIPRAWFNAKVKTSVGESGIISAEEYTARIPTQQPKEFTKKYINAKEYQKLPLDIIEQYFTFAPGDKFTGGALDFEVQPGVAGYGISDLERKHGHIGTISGHNLRAFGDEKHHAVVGT